MKVAFSTPPLSRGFSRQMVYGSDFFNTSAVANNDGMLGNI